MDKDKVAVLRSLVPQFRYASAETEAEALARYFVETDAWEDLIRGDVNVVLGPKGAGKSALYALLLQRKDQVAARPGESVVVLKAEEPLGASVFLGGLEQRLREDSRGGSREPAVSEAEFIDLWKWYFLTLIGAALRQEAQQNSRLPNHPGYREVIRVLTYWGVLPTEGDFPLRHVLDYVMRYVRLRFKLKVPLATLSAELGHPTSSDTDSGGKSRREPPLSELFALADEALQVAGLTIWLALDRLDEAFAAQSSTLEADGLRGLVRTFLDLEGCRHIQLKVFLRSDVFQRVTQGGRRIPQLNRFGPEIDLRWRREQLLSVIMRRMLQSEDLCALYHLDVSQVQHLRNDFRAQQTLFARIFPDQVGEMQPLEWVVSVLEDGKGQVAPRDFIRLIHHALQAQIERRIPAVDDHLLDTVSLQEASRHASEDHYLTAFCAEYPDLQPFTDALRDRRVGLPFTALYDRWHQAFRIGGRTSRKRAKELVDAGVLTREASAGKPEYFRVAPLYRSALNVRPGEEVPSR